MCPLGSSSAAAASAGVLGAKSSPSLLHFQQQQQQLNHPHQFHQVGGGGRGVNPLPVPTPANPLVASAFMNTSRSTPNLDKDQPLPQTPDMVARKFLKTGSVYEALANRSGFDFAPTVPASPGGGFPRSAATTQLEVHHQRSSSASSCSNSFQHHHLRQASSASSDGTTSTTSSCASHSRQVSGLSSYSEDEAGPSEMAYKGSLPNFSTEDFPTSSWPRHQEEVVPPPPPAPPPLSPTTPPAPPVRDASSLKYMKYASGDHQHQWPTEGVVQRGRSWTEGSDPNVVKDKAYQRQTATKKYTFARQLKTVMEKAEKVVLEDPRFITAYRYPQPFTKEVPSRDYKVHSPPERDVAPEKQQSHSGVGYPWWMTSSVPESPSLEPISQSTGDGGTSSNGQETPLLDRLRQESKQWAGCGEETSSNSSSPKRDTSKSVVETPGGAAGGRDSITSVSSQETLKWHGSSSDVSVQSDKQQQNQNQSTRQSMEGVVHSARVQPPQRHNSESVLYYGVDEASAIAREAIKRGGGGSPPKGSPAVDVAPPLPRKMRQQQQHHHQQQQQYQMWSDQVQKNNYINRIQMGQVRPVRGEKAGIVGGSPGATTSSAMRAASLAREEIQPPVSPEFAKPLSVAERIQDLERQARSTGGHHPPSNVSRKGVAATHNGTSLSPSSACPAADSTRMAYLDPEKKHKVSDPELKAIQKQAVWSFFERQTGRTTSAASSSNPLSKDASGEHHPSPAFLSRRMAQSLPRDYAQEFKRLQNEESKRSLRGASKSVHLPPSKSAQYHQSPNGAEAGPACPPRLYRQMNGPLNATVADHAVSPTSSSSSSSSSSSPSTTPTGQSLTNLTVKMDSGLRSPVSTAQKPFPQTPTDEGGVAMAARSTATGQVAVQAKKQEETATNSNASRFSSPPPGEPQAPPISHNGCVSVGRGEEGKEDCGDAEEQQQRLAAERQTLDDRSRRRKPEAEKDEKPTTAEELVVNRPEVGDDEQPLVLATASSAYTPRTHRRLFFASQQEGSGRPTASPCPVGVAYASRCSTPDLPLPPPPPLPSAEDEEEMMMSSDCDEPLPPPPTTLEMDSLLLLLAMDKPPPTNAGDGSAALNPTREWEEWHNIRQANTTVVFRSADVVALPSRDAAESSPAAVVRLGESPWDGRPFEEEAAVATVASSRSSTEPEEKESVSKGGELRKEEEVELECERLSRDLLTHLHTSGKDGGAEAALRSILVPVPEMKTMADYLEGLFEGPPPRPRDKEASRYGQPATAAGGRSRTSMTESAEGVLERSSSSSSKATLPSRLGLVLPADSPYFTTSEWKAKLLARYNGRQPPSIDVFDDVRDGSELAKKKEELVESIGKKLDILRLEQQSIREEIRLNEELGSSVGSRVEQLARANEVDKFRLHVEEVEKITSLLLGLSGRLARAQNALIILPSDASLEERSSLEAKRDKLRDQHEEAKKLKESIDRRSDQVSAFLRKYLSAEEFADYDHFVRMKAKLLVDSREIDNKIKLGEEQMLTLRGSLHT